MLIQCPKRFEKHLWNIREKKIRLYIERPQSTCSLQSFSYGEKVIKATPFFLKNLKWSQNFFFC